MTVPMFSVLFILMAIYFIISVAAEVFVDDFVKPRSLFTYLLISSLITSIAALMVNIDIPD